MAGSIPKLDWATGIAGFSLSQLEQLGAFATKCPSIAWTPPISDTADFPAMKLLQADLKNQQKSFSVNTASTTSLQNWLAVHAFYEIMKSQTGTPTATSALAAFKAAKDIPMVGLITP